MAAKYQKNDILKSVCIHATEYKVLQVLDTKYEVRNLNDGTLKEWRFDACEKYTKKIGKYRRTKLCRLLNE